MAALALALSNTQTDRQGGDITVARTMTGMDGAHRCNSTLARRGV